MGGSVLKGAATAVAIPLRMWLTGEKMDGSPAWLSRLAFRLRSLSATDIVPPRVEDSLRARHGRAPRCCGRSPGLLSLLRASEDDRLPRRLDGRLPGSRRGSPPIGTVLDRDVERALRGNAGGDTKRSAAAEVAKAAGAAEKAAAEEAAEASAWDEGGGKSPAEGSTWAAVRS